MVQSAEQLIRDFFQSWKRNDPDEVAEFFSHEATYTDGPRGTRHGQDEIRTEWEKASKMFPGGFEVTIGTLLTDGRIVMVERVDRGEIGGHMIDMPVAAVFEIGDDGFISRWRDYFDLQQIQDQIARLR